MPSLMEIIDELKVSTTLKTGYVIINDPFQQIMGVKHEQTTAIEVEMEFIAYEQIKPDTWKAPESGNPGDSESEENVPPKKA